MMSPPSLWHCNTDRTCRWFIIISRDGTCLKTAAHPQFDAVTLPIDLNPHRPTASIGHLNFTDSRIEQHRSVLAASGPAVKSP